MTIPVTVEVDGGKTLYRDFLDRIALSEAIERILLGTRECASSY